MSIFDAHLDLADLAVMGRDMTQPLDPDMQPHPPAGVTLPSLREGNVRLVLGTIFTAPLTGDDEPSPVHYKADDPEQAHRRGVAQLEAYRTWQDDGLVRIDLPRLLTDAARIDPHVGETRGGMGVSEVRTPTVIENIEQRLESDDWPLRMAILMENADPIRDPADLEWWVSQGLGVVGMAWWASSRYAAGNGIDPADDFALSELGLDLVKEIDRLGVVHDQSHLSDGAVRTLYEATDRPIIASHSNCRAIVASGNPKQDQRHLTDDMIREIVRRGGVIGLNLIRSFIVRIDSPDNPYRPTLDETLAHVEHICEIAGNTDHVGIGTDMDGGIPTTDLPADINQPADLAKLCDGLRNKGWSDEQVDGFRMGNWARCLASAWAGLKAHATQAAS